MSPRDPRILDANAAWLADAYGDPLLAVRANTGTVVIFDPEDEERSLSLNAESVRLFAEWVIQAEGGRE